MTTSIESNRIEDGRSHLIIRKIVGEKRWRSISIVCILLVTILTGSMLIWYFIHLHKTNTDVTDSYNPLKMIGRNEWTAQPPDKDQIPLNLPVDRLIIAHTNTTSCDTQAHCSLIVRNIQADHVEVQKMGDIAYNFLIGVNGHIYYGRGWNVEGEHTAGFNSNSLCIAMIGTFDTIVPSSKQLDAAQKLVAEGIHFKKLANNYRLYGQRQLISNTTSPGQKLYEILMKTWDHWTAKVQ